MQTAAGADEANATQAAVATLQIVVVQNFFTELERLVPTD